MHIPDGFIAPQVFGPAFGLAGVLWTWGLRRLQRSLDPASLPRLAVTTAAAFALMLVTLPLPGGTTVHLSGVGMLAALFGVWQTFLSLSLVYLLQAVLFGDGGITALPINALAVGFAGALAAMTVLKFFGRGKIGLFLAGWTGTVIPAVIVALILGLQPLIATGSDGVPLFFPFGWDITLPAIIVPHLAVGVGDGLLTIFAYTRLNGSSRA
jgi:cobalt/nickel transport system permease protein